MNIFKKKFHLQPVIYYIIYKYIIFLAFITKRINRDKFNYDFFEICITKELLEDEDTIKSFLLDCQCVLLLIDITDKESFNKIKELLEKIKLDEFPYLKIILLENKIDREKERQIESELINKLINDNKIENKIQISIKDGTGIDELSEKMNEFVNKNENDLPINYISQDINERTNSKIDLDKTLTFILIGNSNCGKTCFYTRINKNQFQENFLTTIGMDKNIKIYKCKNEQCKIIIWDTAGQDRYKSLPRKYYQNADGVFIFFDVTNKESFIDIALWMKEIKDNINPDDDEDESEENSNKIKIYLIGNKIDLLKRCIPKEDAEEKARFYGIKYFEISCKINMNITEILARMISDCFQKFKNNNEKISLRKKGSFSLKSNSINQEANREKKKCC